MKLIMASHGDLAKAMKESAEMIVGKKDDLLALGLFPDTDLDEFKGQLSKAIHEDNVDVLVALDILGGTPFNSIIEYLKDEHVAFITGMNLGMILELLLDVEVRSLQETELFAKEKGVTSIVTKEDVFH